MKRNIWSDNGSLISLEPRVNTCNPSFASVPIHYAVSDDQFFFALNNQKIEQNTHSVSLNLLKILWTHSRHFWSISITYAWYAKLGLSVTCVRHGQTNTYNPLIKWIQFFMAAATNNNHNNNKCTYFENQITSTLKW